MSSRERASSTDEADGAQIPLAPAPTAIERIEKESNEVEQLLKRSTEDALARMPGVTLAEVKRILEARAELIRTIREVSIKLTAPEDWTLYKARDGSVIGVPTAAGALKIRRWAGVSIINHRGMNGQPEPSVREAKNDKGAAIVVVEGFADGICGRDTMPAIYFSVRSDDDFIGRATTTNNRRPGGPRQEDLMSCWRTGIDSKVVRCMTGTTKVSEVELKALGIETSRSVKGSGFGTSAQRDSAATADPGAQQLAETVWKECVKRTSGSEVKPEELLKDVTKGKNFAGFTDWKRMTQDWQIEAAWKALKAHEVFGDQPQGR